METGDKGKPSRIDLSFFVILAMLIIFLAIGFFAK